MRGLKVFFPTVFLFLGLNGLFLLLEGILVESGFSMTLLYIGNLFIFGLSLVSVLLHQKALNSALPQLFVRYFYISFLIKLMLVASVALIYIKTAQQVNKISVITCMVIYLVYTFIELRTLLKVSKKGNA